MRLNYRLLSSIGISLVLHVALLNLPIGPGDGSWWGSQSPGEGSIHPAGNRFTASVRSLKAGSDLAPPTGTAVDMAKSPLSTVSRPQDDWHGEPPGQNGQSRGGIDIPDMRYFRLAEVDKRPELIVAPVIPFPESARPGPSGSLVLRIFVNEQGGIDRIEVAETSLPEAFSTAALTAFRGLRYRAGEIGSVPVKTEVAIEIEFRPDPVANE